MTRFWERTPFTRKYSARVIVDGTRNVIENLQRMPDSSDKILVFCSTAGLCIPRPMLARLSFKFAGIKSSFRDSYVISDDTPCPPDELAISWYITTKAQAEKLVRGSNGEKGLRVGTASDYLANAIDTRILPPNESHNLNAATARHVYLRAK